MFGKLISGTSHAAEAALIVKEFSQAPLSNSDNSEIPATCNREKETLANLIDFSENSNEKVEVKILEYGEELGDYMKSNLTILSQIWLPLGVRRRISLYRVYWKSGSEKRDIQALSKSGKLRQAQLLDLNQFLAAPVIKNGKHRRSSSSSSHRRPRPSLMFLKNSTGSSPWAPENFRFHFRIVSKA